MMKAVRTSKTSVNFNVTSRRYIPRRLSVSVYWRALLFPKIISRCLSAYSETATTFMQDSAFLHPQNPVYVSLDFLLHNSKQQVLATG
jgi:hypothetical protein